MALLWKTLRYPFLRLYHYVYLPCCFWLGIPTPLRKPDRTFLEQKIFGYLASRPDVQDVLFAGVEIYTWHYPQFLPEQHFYTIDMNPRLARYGNGDLHTVGSVCELDKYYKPQQFDVVIYNGLIGFGLNGESSVQLALQQATQVLKPEGLLILGWNNTEKHLNFDLLTLKELKSYMPFIPPIDGMKTHHCEVSSFKRHNIAFLKKSVL